MSKSAFQVKLFKLQAISGSNGANIDEINRLLKYDFKDAINYNNNLVCLDKGYWRNLYFKSNDSYVKYYEDTINDLLKKINNTEFGFDGGDTGIDLTPYFLGITLSLVLNNLTDIITLEFKENDIKIEDNDLLEIKENGKVIFLGFAVKSSSSNEYEGRLTQKITVMNVGKMYSLSKITYNAALAQYAIKGIDLKTPGINVFTDIFNNKNVFDILKFLMEFFFSSKQKIASDVPTKDMSYILDNDKINTMDSFNIIFPLIKALQLYQEKVNTDFMMCTIKNGKHKTYNEGVQTQFRNFKPQIKTATQVLTDTVTHALYDMFIDYNGTLIIRPPQYNYLPLGLDDVNDSPAGTVFSNGMFNSNNDFVIPRTNILDFNYEEDNSKLEVRTDTLFTWSFYGEVSEQISKPQFYEDIPALIKYGFRNEDTKNNPNAMSNKMARALAMYYNHQINNGSRDLSITLKTDKDLSKLKYQLGRLYYIDLPDIDINNFNAGQIIQTKNKYKTSNFGVVGYLRSIIKSYAYGEYIVYKLQFTFVRDIEIISIKQYSDNDLQKILLEIYNIVHPYGILEDMQDKKYKNYSIKQYNDLKQQKLDELYNQILDNKNGLLDSMPIFKTMPTIMDIIELTYSDKETKDSITSAQKNEVSKDSMVENVKIEDGYLCYHSWRIKMQRFFVPELASSENKMKYNINRTVAEFRPQMVKSEVKYGLDYFNNNDFEQIQNIYNDTFKQMIQSNQNPIRNYQTFDAGFKVLNASAGTQISLNSDNIIPSYFQTRFRQVTANGKDLSGISQKLFNRIMEAEAEIYRIWNQDMCEELFYKYGDSINENGIEWIQSASDLEYPLYDKLIANIDIGNVSVLPIEDINKNEFSKVKIGSYIRYNIINTLFDNINFTYDQMPIGDIIDMVKTTDSNIYVIDKNKKENYEGVVTPFIINTALFSPAFLFNLISILNYNVLFAKPSENDLKNLKNIGITENGDSLKKHKEGMAIDFFLPCMEETLTINGEVVPRMPFLYPVFLGNYILKPEIYTQFENILVKYFDKVTKSKQTITLDLNQLKGNNFKDTNGNAIQDLKKYAIYIYHIEVADKNFLNSASELLVMEHAKGIESV